MITATPGVVGRGSRRGARPVSSSPMIKVNGNVLDVYNVIRGEFHGAQFQIKSNHFG